ncbi:MAG: D-2-hydroxyacid dehydrogenase [Anaerolineae bacterium]|nr:D-2-hydroxyacid dehydrogenase [Anaerolineae bacterium]
MKLLVCDPTAPSAVEMMREAGIEVDVRDDISPEELETVIADYDAMVVRSRTKVREPLIDKAANLRLIIRGGVGLDNIAVDYARSKGVEVRNTPAASTNAVAELTLAYLFALARRISQVVASMKDGQWEKKAFSGGTELAGKVLGLVGCGRIGTMVAEKADALGMEVLSYDPYVEQFHRCVSGTELDELLARADFISLHTPYTPETHHLIDAAALAKMKDGVYVVNCGRGGTIDEAALYDAIVSGKVAGAALDVFEDEKQDRGQRLMELPQVIGSPHVGAGTVEAKARVGDEVAQIAIEVANR